MQKSNIGHLNKIFYKMMKYSGKERVNVNPNPSSLVSNMTSKRLNCCVKFIIHKKKIGKNL